MLLGLPQQGPRAAHVGELARGPSKERVMERAVRRHPKRWCARCRKRIYSWLTAQRTGEGLVCVVCQKRALKEREQLRI